MTPVTVRTARAADAGALAAIYGHAVVHGLGTFEEVAPDADEMEKRRTAIAQRALPWLLAEGAAPGCEVAILGFAYAAPFRMRAAYRYTVEDSVYVAPDAGGRGVGRALLAGVIAACEALDLRQMVAVIGDSQNHASRALHARLGFEDAGLFPAAGYKHGRWVDVVWMRRPLGPGDGAAPGGRGLKLGGT